MSPKESANLNSSIDTSAGQHGLSSEEPHEERYVNEIVEIHDEEESLDNIPTNLNTVWETGKSEQTFHMENREEGVEVLLLQRNGVQMEVHQTFGS